MLNVLVTGGNGQLGSELNEVSSEYSESLKLFLVNRHTLNLESESELTRYIAENQIGAILNTAAYTAVDLAEKEIEKATTSNVTIPKLLANISKFHHLRFLHVSTDFVFDGKSCQPYREEDPIGPISVYGKTKARGEEEIQKTDSNFQILRTSWAYSKFGNNFLKTIRRLAQEKPELRIISDQIGSPTWVRDLARVSLQLIQTDLPGIYHYSNEGVASWYDFAKEIVEISRLKTKIIPIETKEYPTPASRPAYSVFNKSKIKKSLNIEIPHWKDSLKACLTEMEKI